MCVAYLYFWIILRIMWNWSKNTTFLNLNILEHIIDLTSDVEVRKYVYIILCSHHIIEIIPNDCNLQLVLIKGKIHLIGNGFHTKFFLSLPYTVEYLPVAMNPCITSSEHSPKFGAIQDIVKGCCPGSNCHWLRSITNKYDNWPYH